MQASDFLVWSPRPETGMCTLGELQNVERQIELMTGAPRLADFPDDAAFSMDPDYPDDMVVTDNLLNINQVIVATEKMRAVVADNVDSTHIEFLPVTIFDHRQRATPGPHWIIHPIDPIDCLDAAASNATYGRMNKKRVKSVDSLVVDTARLPSDRTLFRMSTFINPVLVRRDLAEAIQSAGLSGFRGVELSDFPED